jgi:hypothetical protein
MASSCIFFMGNSTSHVASLINLCSLATIKYCDIVGPASPFLVVIFVGSSFVIFPDAMFYVSSSCHNSTIFSCMRMFISSMLLGYVLKCVVGDFFHLVTYLLQIFFYQQLDSDFLEGLVIFLLWHGSPCLWFFHLPLCVWCCLLGCFTNTISFFHVCLLLLHHHQTCGISGFFSLMALLLPVESSIPHPN